MIGIMTHAIFFLLIISAFMPLIYSYKNTINLKSISYVIKSSLIILIFLAFSYWAYTDILRFLFFQGKSWLNTFINFIYFNEGDIQYIKPVNYSGAPFQLASSWSLIPALSLAYMVSELFISYKNTKNLFKCINMIKSNFLIIIAILGNLWLGIGLFSRMFHVSIARYTYPSYLLTIPAAIKIIIDILKKKNVINTIILLSIIALSSFYGLQDPMISPDIYQLIAYGNKRGWATAEILVSMASPDLEYNTDPRVGVGFQSLVVNSLGESYYIINKVKKNATLITLYLDNVGTYLMRFWKGEEGLMLIRQNRYDIVYNDGTYRSYYIYIFEK